MVSSEVTRRHNAFRNSNNVLKNKIRKSLQSMKGKGRKYFMIDGRKMNIETSSILSQPQVQSKANQYSKQGNLA